MDGCQKTLNLQLKVKKLLQQHTDYIYIRYVIVSANPSMLGDLTTLNFGLQTYITL